jgi:hypothetical protein
MELNQLMFKTFKKLKSSEKLEILVKVKNPNVVMTHTQSTHKSIPENKFLRFALVYFSLNV